LWVLRDVLGLRGTKYGCRIGYCAACTVLIDGRNTKSGQTPAERVTHESIRGTWHALDELPEYRGGRLDALRSMSVTTLRSCRSLTRHLQT
jgi:hypothetical protein